MKTVLAYIIVLVLGQFALTIGVLIGSLLFGLPFSFLPTNIRTPLATTLAGTLGAILVGWFAYLVFYLLTGSFGVLPFLAGVVSMIIPINNDYSRYRRMKGVQADMDPTVAGVTSAWTKGAGGSVVGALLGIIVSGLIFFFYIRP